MVPRTIITLATLLSLISGVLAWRIEIDLLRYPLLAVAVGTGFFVLFQNNLATSPISILSHRQTMLLDCLILIGIASTVFVSITTPLGVSRAFYALSIATATVLAARIMVGEMFIPLVITEITLLGIGIRAALYFSYPIYGQDLFHIGATEYILRYGELVPSKLTYYHNYPVTHITSAAISFLSDFNGKQGLFIAGAVVQVLSYTVLYLVSRQLGYGQRLSVLVVLAVTVSGSPLNIGSEVFAQTMAGGIFVLIFWLLVRSVADKRLFSCVMLLTSAAFLSHHLIVALLIGLVGALWVTSTVLSWLHPPDRWSAQPLPIPPVVITLILGIGALYYWLVTEYVLYQLGRVVTIFSISRGSASGVVDATTPPSTTYLAGVIPPNAQWAGPILLLVVIAVFAGFLLLVDISESHQIDMATQYTIVALSIFAGFAVMYAIGGEGPLTRVMPTVTVLVTPLLAYILTGQQSRLPSPSSTTLAVLLILGIVTTGLLTPSVAMPDRTDESFRPTASQQDIAAIKFADLYADDPVSDVYLAAASEWYGHSFSTRSIEVVLNYDNRENTTSYDSAVGDDRSVIYRDSYDKLYSVEQPPVGHYYDSGSAEIYSGTGGNSTVT